MKKKYLIYGILGIILLFTIILLKDSHALFSSNQINKSAITIKAGTMIPTVKVDGALGTTLTVPANSSKTFTVTLENLNSISGKFLFYYLGELSMNVKFGYSEEENKDIPPREDGVILSTNQSNTYTLKVTNNESSSVTINLGGLGGLSNQPIDLPNNAYIIEEYSDATPSACFVFDKDSGMITDYNDNCPKDVVIPSKINGIEVKRINNEAFANNQLTSIVLPNSEITIADNAFVNNQLTEITIPSNINMEATLSILAGNPITKIVLNTNKIIRTASSAFAGITDTLEVIVNNTNEGFDWSLLLDGTMCPTVVPPTLPGSPAISETSKCQFKTGTYTAKNGREIKIIGPNENITNIYQYDQTTGSSTFCVTGEESTCVQIAPQETYSSGTIIKYKVNDSEEKYFHVVSDNGNTLTLQQRENTVYDTAWYSTSADNSKGPLTILMALENATSGWTNVLDQTYTMGTTVFKDNAFTGCSAYNSCTKNTYTLGERTAKARMITVQEVSSLECTDSSKSCPVWMYNYLNNSTGSGGTVNQTGGEYGNNYAYWTMNAHSYHSSYVWSMYYYRYVNRTNTTNTGYGGRAVVVVEK